jgi:hypothetical protein
MAKNNRKEFAANGHQQILAVVRLGKPVQSDYCGGDTPSIFWPD